MTGKAKKSICTECKNETSDGYICRSCLSKQRFSLKPSDMFTNLSGLVIGQDHVKRVLSVAAVSHLHRIRANQRLKQLTALEEEQKLRDAQAAASSSSSSVGDVNELNAERSKAHHQVAFQERDIASSSRLSSPTTTRKLFAVKVDDSPGSWSVRPTLQQEPPIGVEDEEEEDVTVSSEYDERLRAAKQHNVRNFDKGNILLLGPTGSGKTLMAKTLAEITQGPLVICDATSLTAAGYVGDDVDSILYKLLESVQWDVSKAEQGIVYLDEVDKIAKRVSSRHAKDVGGESVQHGLLKMLEGSKVNITKKGNANSISVTVDTSNILFICAGAFTGIDSIVAKRTMTRSLGFGNSVAASYDGDKSVDKERDRLYQGVEPADLVEFGMIPEFVGRFSSIVSTQLLTEKDLIRILTEPQNAIVNQMKSLFLIAFPKPVQLIFTSEALTAIAKIALSRGSGARGLKIVVERLLSDCQFELPERPWVTHVVVDENVVNGKSRCLEMTQHDFDIWCESHPQYRDQGTAPSPSAISSGGSGTDTQQKMRGVA
jgi:ATP-dependent Clp protease ATP-binding subunit ClpX